jgi:hypothetical protein
MPLKAVKDAAFCCAPSLSAALLPADGASADGAVLPGLHDSHARATAAAAPVHTAAQVVAHVAARHGSHMVRRGHATHERAVADVRCQKNSSTILASFVAHPRAVLRGVCVRHATQLCAAAARTQNKSALPTADDVA